MTPARNITVWRFAPGGVGVAALLLGTACGCAEKHDLVPVSGQVLIDGQPLTTGNVKFVPDGERASWGALDKDGRFSLSCYQRDDGAIRGKHRVQISALEVVPGNKAKWYAPKKYADFRTSGLTFEVSEETDDAKIELTWDGGKPFIEK